LAAAKSGISWSELQCMSLAEISLRITASNELRREAQLSDWQQTRYLAFTLIRSNGFAQQSSLPKRPSDLFYLEGDDKNKYKFDLKKAMKQRNKAIKAFGKLLNIN